MSGDLYCLRDFERLGPVEYSIDDEIPVATYAPLVDAGLLSRRVCGARNHLYRYEITAAGREAISQEENES